MSSIVLQLQQESLDRSVSVTDLLRKSLVVSRKLKLREFEAWINAELIGYGSQDEVPLYRKVKGSVKFFNPYLEFTKFKLSGDNQTLSQQVSYGD